MDPVRIKDFKRHFRAFDDESLIENPLRPLTDEAMQATSELLEERGLVGDGLELRINAVKKEMVTRSGVTNQCDYCGDSTVFCAVRSGGQRFCSQRCRTNSELLAKSISLAPDVVLDHAVRMKFGKCPECSRSGNGVEMRMTFHVISAVLVTHRARRAELRCISCGRRANVRAAVGCLFLGWWSAYGFFFDPRNDFSKLARRIGEAS